MYFGLCQEHGFFVKALSEANTEQTALWLRQIVNTFESSQAPEIGAGLQQASVNELQHQRLNMPVKKSERKNIHSNQKQVYCNQTHIWQNHMQGPHAKHYYQLQAK